MDTGKIKIVWDTKERIRLGEDGWVTLYCCHTNALPTYPSTLFWIMAPPEPTLVARMRDWAKRAPILSDEEFANDQHVVDTLEAADVLERIGELLAGRGEARRERDG